MPSRKRPAPATPARSRRGRRWLAGLLLLLVLLVAGHALLWHLATRRLEAGLALWAEARRAQGWRIAHAAPQPGGWPFAATLRLADFQASGATASLPGGLDWQAEALELRLALPEIGRLQVAALGRQRLRLGGAEIPFAADRLTAILPLTEGVPPDSATIEASQLRLGAGPGGLLVTRAQADLATQEGALAGEPALRLSARLEEVTLPEGAPLGRALQEAQLQARLNGPVPPTAPLHRRAASWRDAGGTLEVTSLSLRWGPVAASAAATLALDADLQPMGAGTLRLAGADAAIDPLARAGLVPAGSAGLLRGLLPLFARPDPQGGPPILELPLTLEDRRLAAARMPILRLPPLSWP